MPVEAVAHGDCRRARATSECPPVEAVARGACRLARTTSESWCSGAPWLRGTTYGTPIPGNKKAPRRGVSDTRGLAFSDPFGLDPCKDANGHPIPCRSSAPLNAALASTAAFALVSPEPISKGTATVAAAGLGLTVLAYQYREQISSAASSIWSTIKDKVLPVLVGGVVAGGPVAAPVPQPGEVAHPPHIEVEIPRAEPTRKPNETGDDTTGTRPPAPVP